jgi:malonate-semialdehyde dehydrogenase (acetylating)/methylmalonate-semialdehyde dehydrogenase
LYFNTLCF